jgi:hypothetical protein
MLRTRGYGNPCKKWKKAKAKPTDLAAGKKRQERSTTLG